MRRLQIRALASGAPDISDVDFLHPEWPLNDPMKNKSDPVNPRLLRAVRNKRTVAANLEAFTRCARVLDPLGKRTRQTAIKALAAIYL